MRRASISWPLPDQQQQSCCGRRRRRRVEPCPAKGKELRRWRSGRRCERPWCPRRGQQLYGCVSSVHTPDYDRPRITNEKLTRDQGLWKFIYHPVVLASVDHDDVRIPATNPPPRNGHDHDRKSVAPAAALSAGEFKSAVAIAGKEL